MTISPPVMAFCCGCIADSFRTIGAERVLGRHRWPGGSGSIQEDQGLDDVAAGILDNLQVKSTDEMERFVS